MTTPVLVACAHGTRSPEGRATVRALAADIRALRPGLPVVEAFVDVQEPAVGDAVRDALATRPPDAAGTGAVVTPLLLSTGYHVRHDIGGAVTGLPAAAAAPLGPDERLVAILLQRLDEAGARPGDAVVVAAAGSSDPEAARAAEVVTARVRATWQGPVTVGYGASAAPGVPDAVAAARAAGAARVVVASYLLAPGHFHSALARAGADVVTRPLGPHPLLARVALDRYDAQVALCAVTEPDEPPAVACRRGAVIA
jgi:sirohydrochlorin ferrochelatase